MKLRRWRVRVEGTDAGKRAMVFVTHKRWATWHGDGVVVASVRLMDDDADEKLAVARSRAADYAKHTPAPPPTPSVTARLTLATGSQPQPHHAQHHTPGTRSETGTPAPAPASTLASVTRHGSSGTQRPASSQAIVRVSR